MPTIHMTRGIPASGKSTFAKAWVAESPSDRVRINRDDIRRMVTGTTSTKLSFEMERLVSRIEKQTALAALKTGRDVIIDATNLRARYVRPWLSLGYDVVFHDFPVSLDLALARNEARGGHVPERVIRDMHLRLTRNGAIPAPPEPVVQAPDDAPEPYVPLESFPTAIIVDIDGTLAHMDGKRGPFEWDKVDGDRLDVPVAILINEMERDHHVILMSGRDEVCRPTTQAWLRDHSIRYDALHMRAEGDNRPDTVVKAELFDTHIRHHYNVLFAVDDRNTVVAQWRAMGIKCLQAQEGAF